MGRRVRVVGKLTREKSSVTSVCRVALILSSFTLANYEINATVDIAIPVFYSRNKMYYKEVA